jgi:hypothetical protein
VLSFRGSYSLTADEIIASLVDEELFLNFTDVTSSVRNALGSLCGSRISTALR